MKSDIKNKLILQLLPAVASRNAGTKPSGPEELKQFWNDCLNEAGALAELYEQHITSSKDAE
jgi:hypothetical protein